ncbi:MAG TPA: hypothetical protein VNS63_10185 [Blastocatellia bacterium]|nr:hypothetical protein [Blastocatellia bacterium]
METQADGETETQRAGDEAAAPERAYGGAAAIAIHDALAERPVAASAGQPVAPPRLRAGLELSGALLLILLVMGWIEFGGPAILDNDGYYHIRWAKMLRESFPHLPAFSALPLTILDEQHYVDHHYLFHLLLIPFTFGDLRVGAKLAAVVFSSLGILSVFALLVSYRVRHRWLWLAPMIASSEPFLYRMSMTRAPALSLVLLGAGSWLIFKHKSLWLAVLSFVFVWSYSLFPLMMAFAVAHAIAIYLSERRFEFRSILASGIGIIAGLVVNPYFPKNLTLFREHLLMKTGGTYSVDVGVEWYPYETWVIVGSSAVAFIIYFAGLLAFDYRSRTRDLKPLFFLLVSTMFLLMTLKSRRFIEYWPPFAVAFAAFTISPKLEASSVSWMARTRDRAIAALAAAAVTVAAVVGMCLVIFEARSDVRSETDPFAYKGASEWLAANTPAGSMVFNTDWDDFPMLYYYNPNNSYIVGLDPTYLYDSDEQLWKLYADITLGNQSNPAPLIRDRFGAEYVFTDNEHPDFMEQVEDSGGFEKVYEDKFATVLRVRKPDEPRPKKDDESEH